MEQSLENTRDAVIGTIMGAFIGDALGLGCHWYYDLDDMKADYGPWIADYVTSKPDRTDRFGNIAKYRYELGLRAGDISQTGQVTLLMLESIAEQKIYDQKDFTRRLDDLLEKLESTQSRKRLGHRRKPG